jgi:hypothetical protein
VGDGVKASGQPGQLHGGGGLGEDLGEGFPACRGLGACEVALDRGVTCAEITGVLVALVPVLGTSRIAPAATAVLGCC